MKTKRPFWRLLDTVTILVLIFPGLAVCQEAGGASGGGPRPPLQQRDVTQIDYSNNRGGFNVFSPYSARFVPAPRLDNTRRVTDLIADGKLMLGLDDAIALSLENNLDIAVARYNLPIAQTDLLRAKGGGATRGVAGSYQSTTLFSGSLGGGVGSGGGGGGGLGGGTLGGGINSVGSAGCCDPSLYVGYGWSN